jgi:hypothetical protein
MGEAIAVTPTPPGVVVNRPGVIVGMTVEAVSVVNVAVDGRARVGVTALEGAQALIKTKPISSVDRIILFFIFTSQTIISLVLHVIRWTKWRRSKCHPEHSEGSLIPSIRDSPLHRPTGAGVGREERSLTPSRSSVPPGERHGVLSDLY